MESRPRGERKCPEPELPNSADRRDAKSDRVEAVRSMLGMHDEMIRQIGLAVLAELDRQSTTGFIDVDASPLMRAARLVHACADQPRDPTMACARLDSVRVHRVLKHISENLDEDLSVAALAKVACLSTFHFTRMFTAAVGMPPHRFVSRKRLENAMHLVASGSRPLSEIALACRFSSQASFTRAFRRVTGVTPGEYRRLKQ